MGVYLGNNPVSVYNGGIKAVKLQEKTVTPSTVEQSVVPDTGYDGLSKVTVKAADLTPKQIKVTTQPNKTTYNAGESIDITGLVVKAIYSDNTEKDITSKCTFSPSVNTVIYETTNKIDITYVTDGITFTTSQAITVKKVLSEITVSTKPTKTTYTVGDTLSLDGMVVTATYTSNMTANVTSSVTANPANGSTLSTAETSNVTISYTENGVTKTTTFSITVEEAYKIVTWAGGTDEEIVAMIEAADNGKIDLADYWSVGQERKVNLSAMAATGVGESHVAQTVTMVLMNAGGKTLATATPSGRTTCSFIVGLKNGLANGTTGEYGYMNSSDTNDGGWDSCARRTWCNNVFRSAIPESLRGIFKQHLNITANGTGSTTTTSTDYFALAAEKEIFGTNTYANSTAETSLTQFTYYATSSNRIKYCGDSGSAYYSWGRSPYSGDGPAFCSVCSDGSADDSIARSALLVAPFGCI